MTANTKNIQVFAIVRVDSFQGTDAALEEAITIKKIVWDETTAEQEVERLNQLNASKGVIYFWQMTRLDSVSSPEIERNPRHIAKDFAA